MPVYIQQTRLHMSEPLVTICVLTYGPYCGLAQRCINSIVAMCSRQQYRLVVGANAVAENTRQYLNGMKERGCIDELIISETNLNKCPMMKKMFEKVKTEFIWWFDDDSYIT